MFNNSAGPRSKVVWCKAHKRLPSERRRIAVPSSSKASRAGIGRGEADLGLKEFTLRVYRFAHSRDEAVAALVQQHLDGGLGVGDAGTRRHQPPQQVVALLEVHLCSGKLDYEYGTYSILDTGNM